MNRPPFRPAKKSSIGNASSRFRAWPVVAAALLWAACAHKDKLPSNPGGGGGGTVLSKVDSLVQANKGTGKGVVTGFLTGEGSKVANGILKQAANAAGERRLLVNEDIPLEGANVLIFNSLKPTTVADTVVTTDSLGNYIAVLPEGQYFAFAVYLDLQTFQLVTTSIPNLNPRADTSVKLDTATAVEDVTPPTVLSVHDATAPNDDNVFLVGSLPDSNVKITVTFSEPMNRESVKGTVLGRVDTSNTTTLTLADTVSGVTVVWSGDSKQMTLTASRLTAGSQYCLILPLSFKDLAKNPMGKIYRATFVPVRSAQIAAVDFTALSTVPADADSLKPIQNPSVAFNRPVDVFSLMKHATVNPAVTGYWEVVSSRATFVHKDPLPVGRTYTVTLPDSIKDVGGQRLKGGFSFRFTVKGFDGAVQSKTGRPKEVALFLEGVFDAYLQGDLGRFGAAFGSDFRMFKGTEIQSKTQFLDMIRKDVGERQVMASGFLAPILDTVGGCMNGSRWKVAAQGGAGETLWVDAYVSPGMVPRVLSKGRTEIPRDSLQWDPTGPRFTWRGNKYGFAPDFAQYHGTLNLDAARGDMRFMGEILKQASTVVLDSVRMDLKQVFLVDTNILVTAADTLHFGDSARLAVKMIEYRHQSRNNYGDMERACSPNLKDTNYQVLKFVLVFDGAKWIVEVIISPEDRMSQGDYNKGVSAGDFAVQKVLPDTLLSPISGHDSVAASDGSVTFRWKGLNHDSVGGYLMGLAEDPRFCGQRPPFGALLFAKAGAKGAVVSVTLDSMAQVAGGYASAILRQPGELRLPGWERVIFQYALTRLFDPAKGFAGVYNWKVIAVRDTSAAQFLANGFQPSRFYGESDFGPVIGYFAAHDFPSGSAFNQFDNQNFQPPAGGTAGFSDVDGDGVPDGIEAEYKTDPRDKNSTPDFRVDTDGDKLADFLEKLLDPTNKDSLVTKKADAAQYTKEIGDLKALGIPWKDTDGDGFPDDVEQMLGFNPADPANNPGTRPKAEVPIGVFAGKLNMGGNLHAITFKSYRDSANNLFSAYTAVIGQDSLKDTVRASFNDLAGEMVFQVILSLKGPDAGKSLWFRGHYDAMKQLVMGPCDVAPSAPKTSTTVNTGPFAGQWAASGRGEDVTPYLGGSSGGGAGGNQPVAPKAEYRLPPSGVLEGATLVFNRDTLTLVNDTTDAVGVVHKDTLAVFTGVYFRAQPSWWEFNAGIVIPRSWGAERAEVGGQLVIANGVAYLNGFLHESRDSAGTHQDVPGQYSAKASASASVIGGVAPALTLTGTLNGWVQQDKSGGGLSGGAGSGIPFYRGNTDSIHAAFKRRAQVLVMKDPQNVEGRADIDTGSLTVDSVSRAFMVKDKANGGRLLALMGDPADPTRLYIKDTVMVAMPMNQGVPPGMGPLLYTGAQTTLRAALAANDTLVLMRDSVTLEGKFPIDTATLTQDAASRIWSAKTKSSPVQTLAFQADRNDPNKLLFKGGLILGVHFGPPGGGGGGNPVWYAGPVAPLKDALRLNDTVVVLKDAAGNIEGKYEIDTASLFQDAANNIWNAKSSSLPSQTFAFAADPANPSRLLYSNGYLQALHAGGGGGGGGTPFFTGTQSVVQGALSLRDSVLVMRDSVSIEGRFKVDVASLMFDTAARVFTVKVISNPNFTVAFIGESADRTRLLYNAGMPVTVHFGAGGGGGGGTILFAGPQTTLMSVLSANDTVVVMRDSSTVEGNFKVDATTSLVQDNVSKIWSVRIHNDTNTVAFVVDRNDPAKLMLSNGKPVCVYFRPAGGGGGPVLFKGAVSLLRSVLSSQDSARVMLDSATVEGTFQVDTLSLKKDTVTGVWMAMLRTTPPRGIAFVADQADSTRPMIQNGLLIAINAGGGGAGGPPAYNGAVGPINTALQAKANKVVIPNPPPTPPTTVTVDPSTLFNNGAMYLIQDNSDPLKFYFFEADPMNLSQLHLDPQGFPMVRPQGTVAGP